MNADMIGRLFCYTYPSVFNQSFFMKKHNFSTFFCMCACDQPVVPPLCEFRLNLAKLGID